MRPTTAFDDNVFDFSYLLHPGTKFDHPKDVVSHPGLTLAENVPSWHPGRPTLLRSHRAPHCGRPMD